MTTMKRSFSLSELQESLESSETPFSHGMENSTLRRVKSHENMHKQGIRLGTGGGAMPTSPSSPHNARAPVLSEKELREHFNMPLNEVAKKYGMCTTALKKLCRKYGVMQWPHRKLRSLEKKIASLKAEQRYTTDGQGNLDDEIRKLEQHREALVNGSGDGGGGDGEGNWSPAPMSPPGDDTSFGEGFGGPAADGPLGHRDSISSDSPRPGSRSAFPDRTSSEPKTATEERMQHTISTLEEENSSLRALSRSLMKERQELLNKNNAQKSELQTLRQTCENLQMQLAVVGEQGGGDGSRGPVMVGSTMLHDDLDVKRKPPDAAEVMSWTNQEAIQGVGNGSDRHWPQNSTTQMSTESSDLHALSWMAPDFELDELL
eukprot:CAMPEP_0181293216 /NCGR_PEP_ID=MMETSP1101-20121128/2946_1 /TAXON_ID=46948 /ORGANISM="Rhodomonas abbreviata, Strain Caron Lab Isolate" /LENGTH=374 /DNA_ID=CAMNT_0023397787 /DNA_START=506 /DNA_END=1630 /DNA_ORIENTATION=+